MPPKAKAKGKAKGDEVPKLDVPPPPPSAMALPLPQALVGRYAAERCLLLAFADQESRYKVQVRGFTPGVTPVGGSSVVAGPAAEELAKQLEAAWVDAKELERVELPSRHYHCARLYSCEHVRLQYRLVLAAGPQTIDNMYVANWASVPSEPVSSYVDPPVELQAKLRYDSDLLPPAIHLSWKSSNMEWLRMLMSADEEQRKTDGAEGAASRRNPFVGWPGLLPGKAQVRWRVVRSLVDEASLPPGARDGGFVVSPALDTITGQDNFSFDNDVWQMTFRDVCIGVVVRVSVRMGTSSRWSPWSDESEDLVMEVPEPVPPGLVAARALRLAKRSKVARPGGDDDDDIIVAEGQEATTAAAAAQEEVTTSRCVELARLGARELKACWPAFRTKGALSFVEYRVMACTLTDLEDTPNFEANGVVVSTFTLEKQPETVTAVVRGVSPSTCYVLQVDARYPHTGKRAFSECKALSEPFMTPFPPRPPLPPVPVVLEPPPLDGPLAAAPAAALAAPAASDARSVSREPTLEVHAVPTGNSVAAPTSSRSTPVVGDGSKPDLPDGSSDAGNATEESEIFDWTSRPWFAVRVERSALRSFRVEYAPSPSVHASEVEYFGSWRVPVIEQEEVDGEACAAADIPSSAGAGATASATDGGSASSSSVVMAQTPAALWTTLRVGLPADAPELVVCRLASRQSILGGSAAEASCISQPIVPYIAPVEFASPASQLRVTDSGARLLLRFLLQPGAPASGEEEPATTGDAPRPGKPGHRFARRFQARFRPAGGAAWVELAPSMMPPATTTLHSAAPKFPAPDADRIVVDLVDEEAIEELRGRLGWRGALQEVEIDPVDQGIDALLRQGPFEVELRVGNDHRWSSWAAPRPRPRDPSDDAPPLPLSLEAPRPMPPPNAKILVISEGAMSMKIEWVPFDRPAGACAVEYLLRAEPVFAAAEGKQGASSEGAAVVEQYLLVHHHRRKSEEELLASLDYSEVFDDSRRTEESRLQQVLEMLREARDLERNEDKSSERLVCAELRGLLPSTLYRVTLTARFPTSMAVGQADAGAQSVQLMFETRGGEAPPMAPRAASPSPEEAPAVEEARIVHLRVESRPGYVLEYRAAAAEFAHFQPLAAQRWNDFGGSWQTSESKMWHRVEVVAPMAGTAAGAVGSEDARFSCVRAELPGLDSGPFGDSFLPDVVQFRLCVASRAEAHPCRWTGAVSPPLATCFAPPRLPPKVRRAMSDDYWCLTLQVEIFKSAPAPQPPKPLETCILGGDDSDDEDHDPDLSFMLSTQTLPKPPEESWATSSVGKLPTGYGHLLVSVVQFRYCLQSGATGDIQAKLERGELSKDWAVAAPTSINSTTISGANCKFDVNEAEGLIDGGIYMFQVRVGDGARWSAWSMTSNAYAYRVPPPTPAPITAAARKGNPVAVEVVSSTVARVRWCDFRPAPGLTMLEYEVRATPHAGAEGDGAAEGEAEGQSSRKVVTTNFEHRCRGGFLEREVRGLAPFTAYVFSVHARYPRVGGRQWWGERQESRVVLLDHLVASQDPPAPVAVPEPKDDGATNDPAGGLLQQCCAVLEFPAEEDGTSYELEYAHILGEDRDTSELRTNQVLWRPVEDLARVDEVGAGKDPAALASPAGASARWIAKLPVDVAQFRGEALKLALMQRAGFRLRARQQPGQAASTTRFWSSMSAPVCLGFAPPEATAARLSAFDDRLVVEVQWALDRRLADAAAAAGVAELRATREQLLKQCGQPAVDGGVVDRQRSSLTLGWPKGFGHAFATRYQLRVRMQLGERSEADAFVSEGPAGGGAEWSAWTVHADLALPREEDRGMLSGGPQQRFFCAEVPQTKGAPLLDGQALQVAIRIGDGVKWSPWRGTQDLLIAVPPPRPAREGDAMRAEWVNDVCTVSWPAAAAPMGLDTIEYQLIAHPDCALLPPRIGAMVVGRSAHVSRRDAGGEMLGPVLLRSKTGRVSTPISGGVPRRALGSSSGPRPLSSSIGSAGGEERPRMIVQLGDLNPELQHSFSVLARYPTVGPRTFTRVFEAPKIAQKTLEAVGAAAPADEGTLLPLPRQVPVPRRDAERLARWFGDDAERLVILTWRGLTLDGDGSLVDSSLEVHFSGLAEARKGRRMMRGNTSDDSSAWQPTEKFVVVELDGRPCFVVRDLPFYVLRFRLFNSAKHRAGPATAPMVAAFQQLQAAPVVALAALGRGAPKCMAARLTMSLASAADTAPWATRFQVRFRDDGMPDDDIWEELEPTRFDADGLNEASELIREEDGLDLDRTYLFQVRVGDANRLGPWSPKSKPLRFSVPPPVPPPGAGIRAQAEATIVDLSWDAFRPQAWLVENIAGFAQLPVEYVVAVVADGAQDPVATRTTRDTSLKVHSLAPSTAYTVKLVARWTRFEQVKQEAASHLLACFVTAPSPTRVVAELSMRHGCDRDLGTPAIAELPLEGHSVAAVTLDLDPFFLHPRQAHTAPAFVRKPSLPSPPSSRGHPRGGDLAQASGGGATTLLAAGARALSSGPAMGVLHPGDRAASPEAPRGGRQALPQLVPLPPAKFAVRDPLSFALPRDPSSARPTSLRRFRPPTGEPPPATPR